MRTEKDPRPLPKQPIYKIPLAVDSWRGICDEISSMWPYSSFVIFGVPKIGARGEFRQSTGIGAPIIDGQLFRHLVDLEIRRAQRLRYCVSLVRIASDLPRETGPRPEPPFAEMIAGSIRATDVVARWAATSLGLLLVGADVPNLPAIVGRLTIDIRTVWSAGGSCYPGTATGTEDLLHQAEDRMLDAQTDGANRLHLPT